MWTSNAITSVCWPIHYDLSDVDEDILENFLQFLYKNSYTANANGRLRSITALHLEVYILAERLNVQNLKTFAMAEAELCLKDISTPAEDLLTAIRLVYTNTPARDKAIRDIILKSVRARMSDFFRSTTLKEQPAETLYNTQDAAMDIIESYATQAWKPSKSFGF